MPELYGKDLYASSYIHPCSGNSSFIPWDRRARSFFFANQCSQIAADSNKDSSRRVLAILTACILVGDSCRIGSKSPALFGLFVELFLDSFFPYFMLNSEEKQRYLGNFSCTSFSVLHAEPF